MRGMRFSASRQRLTCPPKAWPAQSLSRPAVPQACPLGCRQTGCPSRQAGCSGGAHTVSDLHVSRQHDQVHV